MNSFNLLVIFIAIGYAKCDTKRMLPHERSSIDDCDLRFYKQFQFSGVLPSAGRPAYLREFAHIAAIGWTGQGSTRWLCAGSLIWENFILTVAHCAVDENNIPPDVARLGDININSDHDDAFAQELKIVDIIRHPKHQFSSTYYDIALMRLEKNVTVSAVVVPTCLWLDDEIRFPKLLAAGWGSTGIGENHTDKLLKVELAPMSNDKCSTYYARGTRTLRNGLMDHQLCAGDEKMDTCPGDSGGPLHVKLFQDWRLIPFLVGVTSFGKVCGMSAPGVYVKVSSFGDWIIETLQSHGEQATRFKFKPLVCAARYYELREYKEDAMTIYNGQETENWDNKYVSPVGSDYVVNFRWPYSLNGRHGNCSGTLIEPNVVLTLAECMLREESWPTDVLLADSSHLEIAEIIVHPHYNRSFNPYYNNIAVVKLKTFAPIAPFCGWYGESSLSQKLILAAQRVITNESFPESNYATFTTRVWEQSQGQCHLARRYAEALPRGLLDEHLCYGNEPFLVPGACDSLPGSPIEWNDLVYVYIEGINLFGRDCGYGEPGVAVRLSAHRAWLETVLLPRSRLQTVLLPRSRLDALIYIDADLEISDECVYADGTKGTCTPQQECPAIHIRQQNMQQLIFCTNNTVCCCPKEFLERQSIAIENEFNQCEERYKHLRAIRQEDISSHVVRISRRNGTRTEFHCYGYLISTRGVVSSASCLTEKFPSPNIVHLGGLGSSTSSKWIRIQNIDIHPKYSASTQQHDIAIVQLESAVEPSEHAFPGCLWQNVTHSPVQQEVYDAVSARYDPIHPMYKSDCEAILNRSFDEPEMICMNPGVQFYLSKTYHYDLQIRHGRKEFMPDQCYSAGSPIVWKNYSTNADSYIEYLVNVYSHGSCNATTPRVVNRVAPYIEWFKQVLQ
ncbi:uncharacterized protein LOC128718438 [Anopheles marshallii]|uniref:uncharacterized protein LOC128718438 n=1 Tax=Anopheles marshallii TaxID=1521116 RepID=UPI00237A322A|nr:uncharacterized protein LOC128718438 [Anopheles marshallii]